MLSKVQDQERFGLLIQKRMVKNLNLEDNFKLKTKISITIILISCSNIIKTMKLWMMKRSLMILIPTLKWMSLKGNMIDNIRLEADSNLELPKASKWDQQHLHMMYMVFFMMKSFSIYQKNSEASPSLEEFILVNQQNLPIKLFNKIPCKSFPRRSKTLRKTQSFSRINQ